MTRATKAGLGLFLVLLLLWAAAVFSLRTLEPGQLVAADPWHPMLPFFLTRTQDVWILPVFLLSTLVVLPLMFVGGTFELTGRRLKMIWAALLAFVFALVLWGSYEIYLAYPLSMDEYFADHQATVYASGALGVPVPQDWLFVTRALFHGFMRVLDNGTFWFGAYLPIHSMFRAPFEFIGVPAALNAFGVVGSVILVAHIARRLFPDDIWAPIAAALLLAGSAQVLIMGMTAYAHTMHLFLNLLWLVLFMSERRWAIVLLPVVGVLAIGLHQVHYHLLFAFPFFVCMLHQRRWLWLAYMCPIYGAAFLGFSNWFRLVDFLITDSGSIDATKMATQHLVIAAGIAKYSSTLTYNSLAAGQNFFRLFAWQHLLLLPLIAIAVFHWRRLPTILKLLVAGCVITLALRFTITPNPGHQWGYRYMHYMLGNLVLLAVAGLVYLREELPDIWRPRLARLLVWGSLASVAVLLPIRAVQVNEFVRPFADASGYLANLPQDVVIVDTESIWIGSDLVRNDPWLRNRPLLLDKRRINAQQRLSLANRGSVVEVGADELARFGIRPRNNVPK